MNKLKNLATLCIAFSTLVNSFEKVSSAPNGISVDFNFNSDSFKEIGPGILHFVGADVSDAELSCELTNDKDAFLSWRYHGIEERNIRKSMENENGLIIDFTSGPPVLRMECFSPKYTTISNSTLIYTGENRSPYLYKNGQTIKATVSSLSIANLPCLLKYPLNENGKGKKLQLLKDGEQVQSEHWSYTPELGYHLNLTQLENPLGMYECRVENSSIDDAVFVKLDYGAFVHVNYTGYLDYFYAGSPQMQPFECKLQKNMFENDFKWYYLWNNGKYTSLVDAKTEENDSDSIYYTQTVKTTFPDVNIAAIVCTGTIKNSESTFNNSYSVNIRRSYPPNILNQQGMVPIIYRKGMNITCLTNSEPVTFTWLKDGKPLMNGEHIKEYHIQPPFRSSLILKPGIDDIDTNYTCIVENFMGEARHNFRVQLSTCKDTTATVTSNNII